MTIWCDNASVVRGVHKLLQNPRYKGGKSHSDLWLIVKGLVANLAPAQVQIVKVQAHASVELAETDLEKWAFFHNSLVDAAAKRINQLRTEEFHQCRKQAHEALLKSRAIHAAVAAVHVKTARRSVAEGQVPQRRAEPAAPVASDVQASVVASEVGPIIPADAQWHWPPELLEKVGSYGLNLVHKWWTGVGVGCFNGGYRLQWVSGLQLFLDFYFSTGSLGPVYHLRRWLVERSQWEPAPPLARRVRSFMRIVQQLWQASGVHLHGQYLRCSSAAITHRFQCVRIPWDPSRLSDIDSRIMSVLGCQLTNPKQIEDFTGIVGSEQWLLP